MSTLKRSLQEQIKQRRSQMLIHSYIYYYLDDNIVSDHQWSHWARELVGMQEVLQMETGSSDIGFYDEYFRTWDGTSGFDIPVDTWIATKAIQLLQHKE